MSKSITLSPWRLKSQSVMGQIYNAGRKEGLSSGEILKRIDAAYPFGAREYHPYKIWLSVRRDYKAYLGLPGRGGVEHPEFTGTMFEKVSA